MGEMAMKISDLQIGDWIRVKGHLDCDKVLEIAMDERMRYYISIACSATLVRVYEFEPLRLTAEILENNGFTKVNSQRYELNDGQRYINVNQKKGYIYVNGKKNHCNVYDNFTVHGFQHALRICGLSALANNLKV